MEIARFSFSRATKQPVKEKPPVMMRTEEFKAKYNYP
jgi:hypothetical protein